MNIKDLFTRKKNDAPQEQVTPPQPLRIEGIPEAPLTPEPDDAEIAAQALLEMMAAKRQERRHGKAAHRNNDITKYRDNDKGEAPAPRTVAYYRHLAWRMQKAREATRLRVTRFLAFVEQELKKPHLPAFGEGSLGLLEAELFKRQDIVERERGELLRRWQHCLALVTVRLMEATHNDNDNDNENADSSSTTN